MHSTRAQTRMCVSVGASSVSARAQAGERDCINATTEIVQVSVCMRVYDAALDARAHALA